MTHEKLNQPCDTKSRTLVELASALRQQLAVGDDIELVVVVSSTDGEFVGVSANIPIERLEKLLLAAATSSDRIMYPVVP